MCIDFTNLNKACPKDHYPLSSIERLIDSTSGYAVISFLDAILGYHQILMDPEDAEKTNFIIEEGVFLLQHNALQIKECRGNLLKARIWHFQRFGRNNG